MQSMIETRNCDCVGIEKNPVWARTARKLGLSVIEHDIQAGLGELSHLGTFDHIIFGDVLEHTSNPEDVLKSSRLLLRPDGSVIVSLPNVVSLMSRIRILAGKWQYTDTGILDRTHLRFFCIRSGRELICDSGFRIIKESFAGPMTFHMGRVGILLTRARPNLLANQMIFEIGT